MACNPWRPTIRLRFRPAAEYSFQCMASPALVVSGICSQMWGSILRCDVNSIEAWASRIHHRSQVSVLGNSRITTSARDMNISTSSASRSASTRPLKASVEPWGTTPLIFEIRVTPDQKCWRQPLRSFSEAVPSSSTLLAFPGWSCQKSIKASLKPTHSASLKSTTCYLICINN